MLALTCPVETPFHRIPAAAKLLFLAVFTWSIFFLSSPLLILLPMAVVFSLYLLAGRGCAMAGLHCLRPVVIFVAVILVWHLATGDVLVGLMLSGRLIVSVALANLVTMTTRLYDMLGVAETLLAPLERVGLPKRGLGFAMALVLRFVPTLAARARDLGFAWRARSSRAPKWHILIPLTLSAIDDAERVAEALKARGGVPTNLNRN